jgi:hypothetical protein
MILLIYGLSTKEEFMTSFHCEYLSRLRSKKRGAKAPRFFAERDF